MKTAKIFMHGSTVVVALLMFMTIMLSNQITGQEASKYGFFADDPALTFVGDFLTDIPTAEIDINDDATYRIVTNSDSAYAGESSMLINFQGGKSDRVRFAVDDPVDFSQFNNNGKLVFKIKLLDTLDLSVEVEALRDGDEVNGTDASLEEEYGLDRFDLTNWQEFSVEMSSVGGKSFDYSQFRRLGFRSKYNASSFLVDEIHVEYGAAVGVAEESVLPERFNLSQNYPNPFNPTTTIEYQIAKSSKVDLNIYNLLGQKVATIVSTNQTAGIYSTVWNATEFSSGIYYYVLSADNVQMQTRKLILLK